ncbi:MULTISPECIES: GGDEF domain-containing protein [Giesbergeria]|uniref:diguanylate cyclase n=1 Tax=Giesbergeria sinuosa TaxID=80883 RepID=A0ABV9QAA9_9BURK
MDLRHSLAGRTLRLAVLRISMVVVCASVVSYVLNRSLIEEAVRAQLLLSTEKTIQRESLPFREIRELQQNFLAEFRAIDRDPLQRQALVRSFDDIFYRHDDGSYTQRPGLFEGQPLADGRRFANMSATYAPDIAPSDDVKARFVLSYLLSHKYGSTTQGRLFNFYGVVPEKGFPIYQAADIAKVFHYRGPEALKLETYEFYSRGFASGQSETFLTRMYFDSSNNAWMTTMGTPDTVEAGGQHRILACVDILLDDLMERLARPSIEGAYSTLFLADTEGTLMFHPQQMEAIQQSEGKASIESLHLGMYRPLLHTGGQLEPGKVVLVDTPDEIVAVGRIPETPTILTIHYPRALMQPAILQNLAVVATLGLVTLLVEVFLLRSILQNQVTRPLQRLMRATREVGATAELGKYDLPVQSGDEIGELSRDFTRMSERIYEAHERLESTVQQRTLALEEANQKLAALSMTDSLTGLANRRHFDEALHAEWQHATRSGSYVILAMLDVDWFKKYNDHYGHQGGDKCLRRVAHSIQAHAHRAGDVVARYGGEEFVLIITNTPPEEAQALVQSMCQAVRALQLPHPLSPFGIVTVSIGMAATIPRPNDQPSDLLQQADAALYQAKAAGRNQVVQAG